MPEKAKVESLIEACVTAGLALRIAGREASTLKATRPTQRVPLGAELARLAEFDARVTRLGFLFVASQGPLSEAMPAMFLQHMAEVNRRIEDRLRDAP